METLKLIDKPTASGPKKPVINGVTKKNSYKQGFLHTSYPLSFGRLKRGPIASIYNKL